MALKKEAIIKTLKALKVADDLITQLVDSPDEVDIDLPADIRIYDGAGYSELETNIRKGYIKEKDSVEIWCRKMNEENELGLTGAAAKDPKKISEAMKAKAIKEAGITPAEWETKFTDLQKTIDTKNQEVTTYQQQMEALRAEKEYRKLFFADMNKSLDEDEWLNRLQKTFEIKADGDVKGLWDKQKGKFVTDEKANTLPFTEAWETLRKEDRFKSWYEPKVDQVTPDPKKTHAPQNQNPAGPRPKKYATSEDIMKEVDKQYPSDKKGKVQGWAKKRQELFNKLRAETV